MGALTLIRHNSHKIEVDGHSMLLHVPSTGLFELDEIGRRIYEVFSTNDEIDLDEIASEIGHEYSPQNILECVRSMLDMEIVRESGVSEKLRVPSVVESIPLSTIVLNVNTGCNLSCTYCYKEDLTTPSKGEKMQFDTAKASFDLLLHQAKDRAQVNVVFFGGEPLSNYPLIQQVVEYGELRAKEEGKAVEFSLTTNGTLLTESIVDWLDLHKVAVTVSMDGPKALHDKNRITVGGQGTYEVVARKVKMLLERYKAKPVGVRVTLTRGVTDVIGIHEHLKNNLGFAEVGFGPVTSGGVSAFNLDSVSLKQVFDDMKVLGRKYVEAACRNENIGFSNMHQLLVDISQGTKKAVPCGAGLGLLAVDKKGDLHLCHRFVGSNEPTYGNVTQGIDTPKLASFITKAQDRSQFGCNTCRIRSICAGGCYHESYARQGDPFAPVYHYCDLLRDWVDFGIESYVKIMTKNPAFFRNHLDARSK